MPAAITLWGHALAALLFGMLAAAQLRHADRGLPRLTFAIALGATAVWALAVAGIEARDVATRLAEGLRNLAWLGFMLALVRRDEAGAQRSAITAVYGVVALVVVAGMAIAVAEAVTPLAELVPIFSTARLLFRMMVAVSALVLVHQLLAASVEREGSGARIVVLALAGMWAFDLALYTTAYLTSAWPAELVAARGIVMVLLMPFMAAAALRQGDWTLQPSRTIAYQSLSAIAVALYVGAMLLATAAIGTLGGQHARIVQTAFVFGSTTALITIASTPWLRAWAKVKVAKHLFSHRYDYRAEWVRFTDTLGVAGDESAPLDRRIVKAVADLTDSPAGVLLVPDGRGLGVGTA